MKIRFNTSISFSDTGLSFSAFRAVELDDEIAKKMIAAGIADELNTECPIGTKVALEIPDKWKPFKISMASTETPKKKANKKEKVAESVE